MWELKLVNLNGYIRSTVCLICERFWRLPKVSEATSSLRNSLPRLTVSLLNSDRLWVIGSEQKARFVKKYRLCCCRYLYKQGKTFLSCAKLSRKPYRDKGCLCQIFLNHRQFYRTPFTLSAITTFLRYCLPRSVVKLGVTSGKGLPRLPPHSSRPTVFPRSLCGGDSFK